MTQFVELNLPDYSFNKENKLTTGKFCISCLGKNVPFINLAICIHANVLDNLLDNKISHLHDYVICSWCHNLLIKVAKFRKQVSENISILNSRLKDNLTKNYTQKLKFSKIELHFTTDSQPIQNETIERTANNETAFEIGTEVKIEQDDCLDFEYEIPLLQIKKNKDADSEHDIPLVQIKKQLAKKPQRKKGVRKVNGTRLQRYEDKVKIVLLSEEELLEERRRDELKEKYVNLPYKCGKCIVGFDHELNLIGHLEKRHKKVRGSRVCNICESVLNTKLSFDEHHKRHYRRYECTTCGKRNNNVYSVLKHYNETHGKVDMNFSCNECDFTTESHRSFRYHKDKHRISKVDCEQCGSTFVNKAGLRAHMLTVHKQSDRVYSCEPCGKVYRFKSGLRAHLLHAHEAAPRAYCAPCDMSFRSEPGLRHHLRTAARHVADEDKKFACNECEAKFLLRRQLQEHVDWTHLNKRTQHVCSKCSKTFKNGRNLKRHTTFVHEKKRPPRNKICDHCGRGFTSSTILRSHIRTHTGERPLRCAHCAATFAHSAALYTHNKLLHNKQSQ